MRWEQLNRKVKLKNVISTLGLKRRLGLQWTGVKMKLFLKAMKTVICGSLQKSGQKQSRRAHLGGKEEQKNYILCSLNV